MSSGHRHHAANRPIDKERERELRILLANPTFRAAVQAYNQMDCEHDVPYVGGSKIDWRTVCWDVHFCQAIARGLFKVQGRAFDARVTGNVHEMIEGAILHLWELVRELLGWGEPAERYFPAHDIADVAERLAVAALGMDWQAYQDAFTPFIRLEEHEQITDPAQGLLLDPYDEDHPVYAKLAAAGGQESHQADRTSAAGGEAGPEVLSSAERALPHSVQAGGLAGGGLGGDDAGQAGAGASAAIEHHKVTHEAAGYHKGPAANGNHCGICTYFIAGNPADCKKVVPPIKAQDGCGLFERKPRFNPSSIGATQAPDGHHYVPHAGRPGKYLRVHVHG